MTGHAVWKLSMVPERKQDGNFMKDEKIHGESIVRSVGQS